MRSSSGESDDGASSDKRPPQDAALVVAEKRRRRKTNSERGKEFRAKRKEHEASLLELITSLRQEVRDLQMLRDIRHETALVMPHSPGGSLVRLAREYFALFARGRPLDFHVGAKRGSPTCAPDILQRQTSFLAQVIDESVDFGGVKGGMALLDQWERYTKYHARFTAEVASVEVVETADAPIVKVVSDLCVTLSRDTFTHIFPHVADDEELIERLVGCQVTYRGVNQLQFSEDGKRIMVYEADVDFVNAFLGAGVGIGDVAKLMQQALIAEQYLIGEQPRGEEDCQAARVQILDEVPVSPVDEEDAHAAKRACPTDIAYLLN